MDLRDVKYQKDKKQTFEMWVFNHFGLVIVTLTLFGYNQVGYQSKRVKYCISPGFMQINMCEKRAHFVFLVNVMSIAMAWP